MSRTRALHRESRDAVPYPTVALVGYTNSGKSTLMNALTDAGVLVADQLFATLDPTVRLLRLADGGEALLVDTVGFIHKLPHGFVDAFKSTLEEVQKAHLLLHVVDGSDAHAPSRSRVVEGVLAELGVDGDAAHHRVQQAGPARLRTAARPPVSGPSVRGLGPHRQPASPRCCARSRRCSPPSRNACTSSSRIDRGDLLAALHKNGRIAEQTLQDGALRGHRVRAAESRRADPQGACAEIAGLGG